MNVDAWLSGAEGTRVVEVMAEAGHYAHEQFAPGLGWETNPRSRVPWDDVPVENRAVMLIAYRAGLRAALSLTTTCAGCGGTGGIADYYSLEGAENGFESPCPDCEGGTVPGESVLVVREQLGTREPLVLTVASEMFLKSRGNLTDAQRREAEQDFLKAFREGHMTTWIAAAGVAVDTILGSLRPLEKEDET